MRSRLIFAGQVVVVTVCMMALCVTVAEKVKTIAG